MYGSRGGVLGLSETDICVGETSSILERRTENRRLRGGGNGEESCQRWPIAQGIGGLNLGFC